MRSPLFVAGIIVILMGGLFYVLRIPLVYFWSIPFVIAGAIMAGASPFLPESEGPIQPQPGEKFCVFCSAAIPAEAGRCPHCNGVQPRRGD